MIYTSNFANIKKLNIDDCVSIAMGTPTWFKGVIFKELQPTWDMVMGHKSGSMTDEEYIIEYDKILKNLDPKEISEKLDNKILLCWCGKGKFCHRNLVAWWLNENGILCGEI